MFFQRLAAALIAFVVLTPLVTGVAAASEGGAGWPDPAPLPLTIHSLEAVDFWTDAGARGIVGPPIEWWISGNPTWAHVRDAMDRVLVTAEAWDLALVYGLYSTFPGGEDYYHPTEPIPRGPRATPAEREHALNVITEALAGPEPTCSPEGYGVERWRSCVARYFPASQVNNALRVIACETGNTGNPYAKNSRSSASGLFQFLNSTWASWGHGSVFNAEQNVAAASRLWASSGWRPWSCKP